MRTLCSILLLSCAMSTFAQTKKIAHRSHSGQNSSFSMESLDNLGRRYSDEELEKMRKSLQEKEFKFPTEEVIIDSIQVDSGTAIEKKPEIESKPENIQKKEPQTSKKSSTPATKKHTATLIESANNSHDIYKSEYSREFVTESKNQKTKTSEASINWMLLLMIIAVPSVFAIKSINLKL